MAIFGDTFWLSQMGITLSPPVRRDREVSEYSTTHRTALTTESSPWKCPECQTCEVLLPEMCLASERFLIESSDCHTSFLGFLSDQNYFQNDTQGVCLFHSHSFSSTVEFSRGYRMCDDITTPLALMFYSFLSFNF